jgi:hypothetical protein
MKHSRRLLLPALFLAAAGCGQEQGRAPDVDLRPPMVLAVRPVSGVQVCLEFDEEAQVSAASARIAPDLEVTGVSGPAAVVSVGCSPQVPGTCYVLEAEARDARGNSATFLAEFYGFNPRVPRVVVNEFIARGTETHPDAVEVGILSDGNMGGVVLYEGTPGSFDDRLVFPAFEVMQGDFIVAHFKPAGDPSEVDETADRTLSGGLDASDSAFDFWVDGGDGIGGNNGVLSLYASPCGPILDGVLYSNRTSQSDENFGGFGTAETLARTRELVRDGGWRIAGELVAPEDGFSPEGSTGTRSICRSSANVDTDSATDWHIVPTRGASLGRENSDEAWVPSP